MPYITPLNPQVMKCLIIDDNAIARATIKKLAQQDPGLTVVGECADSPEAYRLASAQPVDLLLLDIEMPGMSGIELVRSLDSKPIVIFTTSKKEYAAEAFELNVADYITKPVTTARFVQAIERAREIYQSRSRTHKVQEEEFVFFRDSNIVRRLPLEDILFAEAMGDYVKLYTPQKMYAVHTTLREVESKLPAPRFLRVHRSFIVQVGKIDTLEGTTLIVGRNSVPVADSYRAALHQRLSIL